MTELLPRDGLDGYRVGISVSESADLTRLGLLENHFRLAVGEISRAVFLADGTLAYGGHLEPEGYTPFLAQELQRFGSKRHRLLVCLAWPVHRQLSLDDLATRKSALGRGTDTVYLDPSGTEIAPDTDRGKEPVPVTDQGLEMRSLTAMRRYMLGRTSGRVLIGGKRAGFRGQYPGLLEEALISLDARQPLYLAGGFGGVTADIAETLGIGDAWLPPDADVDAPDPRLVDGLSRVSERRVGSEPWTVLHNGLDATENAQLAATHRPSDIAALVTLGLSRVRRATTS